MRWKHQAHFAWIVCPIEHMTPASPNTKAFCAYNKIHSFTHLQIYQYHLIPKISSLGKLQVMISSPETRSFWIDCFCTKWPFASPIATLFFRYISLPIKLLKKEALRLKLLKVIFLPLLYWYFCFIIWP